MNDPQMVLDVDELAERLKHGHIQMMRSLAATEHEEVKAPVRLVSAGTCLANRWSDRVPRHHSLPFGEMRHGSLERHSHAANDVTEQAIRQAWNDILFMDQTWNPQRTCRQHDRTRDITTQAQDHLRLHPA